jgi:hypothetical protein
MGRVVETYLSPLFCLEKAMSLSQYLSKHLPGMAGGSVSIAAADAGVATITTGLKEVRSASANLKQDGVTANEESAVTVEWGTTDLNPGQIRITVEKGGTNHGSAADSAVVVAFTAMGDR